MPAVLGEMSGTINTYDGGELDRIVQKSYNLEDEAVSIGAYAFALHEIDKKEV
jgi:hypothetical protein